MDNELQRKKKAIESAQEDINATNARVNELTQEINNLLSINNDLLVYITYCFYLYFIYLYS